MRRRHKGAPAAASRARPPQSPETSTSAKSLRARSKHGARVGGAAGRLIELGEGERGAEFEAARTLLLCDGKGGLECFLREGGIGGVALEQDFAARAMQIGFERAIVRALGSRQRFIEDSDGAAESPARASASASAIFNSPSNTRTFCSRRRAAPWHMSWSPPAISPPRSSRTTLQKHSERVKHGQIVLSREADEFECVGRGR